VKRVADALEVSRSNLYERLKPRPERSSCAQAEDEVELREAIRAICDARPGYGYPRVSAVLNRDRSRHGLPRVNRKKVYRIMGAENLLLQKFGRKPTRTHDGKVMTLASNLRFCTDIFHVSCWNGDLVRVAFVMDCCDREVVAHHATSDGLTGEAIRDLMIATIEARFGGNLQPPQRVQWLSDNGPQCTARETVQFGRQLGFDICTSPAYSPESNGMAEGFVKRFKHDYVYVNELRNAGVVLRSIPAWIEDYNNNAPHSALRMRSPREFRQSRIH